MSVTLGSIITSARALHPAFDRSRVPDTVLASGLSEYQNTLISLAVLREKTFASQAIGIGIGQAATDGDLLVDLSVTGIPFVSSDAGFIVRMSDTGVPYLDSTRPISIVVDQGVQLPIVLACIGGTTHYADGQDDELCITSYGRRFDPPDFPAVYFNDQLLMLVGCQADWNEIVSIELRVTPLTPALTSLDDYFLVPDGARPCLVAQAASIAAERAAAFAQSQSNAAPDVNAFAARAERAEDRYLSTLRISKRARHTTMRNGGN